MTTQQDIYISKTLSWILRHGAAKEGINITTEGYVVVTEILNHSKYKGRFNIEDIKRVVNSNDKQRFTFREINGVLEIKANQGHSIQEINQLSLTPIEQVCNFDIIHGTYFKSWESIKINGLSRMRRNHIHFAKGLPKNKTIISGMRENAQIFIYIDLKLALDNKINFFESENGVILSPGNKEGVLEPKYFKKVVTYKGVQLI